MLIYKDIISGDEVLTSAFDIKEVGTALYEVDCQMITLGAVEVNTGANASAEEADEGTDDQAQTINNVVHSCRLHSTSFDKKSYLTYLKGYMKKVKDMLPEEKRAEFESGAQAAAKGIVAKFKDYEFYTGESMDPDGMVLLLNYREDGVTPYFTVWRHGLKEEKV